MYPETSRNHTIISKKEVLLHNQPNDCWIIVQNKVYDITLFIKEHPGGSDILLTRAGEDASSYFFARHGNNKAITKQLERYLIGELPEYERIPAEAFNEPFIEELVKECQKKNLFNIDKKTATKYNLLRFFSISIFLIILITVFYLNTPFWIALPLVILNSLISTSLFGFIAHENTHRNFPENNILKLGLSVIWPVLWPFISQKPLQYEHNSHHIKIGDEEHDFEVAGFAKFIRYSGTVKHSKWHNYQHHLALFFYPFYANIITTWGGIKSDFWDIHNRKVALLHNVSLFFTFLVFIVLPALLHGKFWYFTLMYLLYQCVLFYGIYIGAAINHFIPQSAKVSDPEMMNKYGYYICSNTSNFAAKSRFWFWYTGGFNVQIEHHLMPFVPVENLKKLIPIVKNLCQKYDYPYTEFESFSGLWNAHYDYLKNMSGSDNSEFIKKETASKQLYQAR